MTGRAIVELPAAAGAARAVAPKGRVVDHIPADFECTTPQGYAIVGMNRQQ
jgi:hypothetical protein